MNNLKRSIIYQFILVSIVLVTGSVYLWQGATKLVNWVTLNLFNGAIIGDFIWIISMFVLEVALFSMCAYWYYSRVSKYIEEETKKQIKEQNQLFANIAHDLKSPMTAVIGLSRALEEGLTSREQQNEITHIITEKSKRIDKIINLMFQYAKLESPSYKLNKSNVDIVRMIKELVAQKYNEFEDKEMELNLKLPNNKIMFCIDELEISRVIDNLMTNSIIHNPKGSRVQIGLEEFQEHIKIWIADSGDEIQKEIEEKIFSPFVCAEESRNTKNGSGLGLAISKKIIEAHNGQIFIEKNIEEYKKSFVIILQKVN